LGFFKITFNVIGNVSRVCIHNSGCNFHCIGCTYKIKAANIGANEHEKTLRKEEIFEALEALKPNRVHFLGGEPTINPILKNIAMYAHEELKAITKIGHSNGSERIPEFIDEASVSIKTFDETLHILYTGVSNTAVLHNFEDAYKRGIKLEASTVLIPHMIPAPEIEQVARFIADIDPNIPFHITSYIPVPGVPLLAPTSDELKMAVIASQKYLKRVESSRLRTVDLVKLRSSNPEFMSIRVA
jgi:pyruvate formate lyase activating enzyme